MSAAAAAEILDAVPVQKSGKKKLILIGVVVLLVLAIAGGGAAWWLKKRAAQAAELAAEEDGGAKLADKKKIDIAHPPTFLPLEPFVVNLADRDADRYAQIGITFELESAAVAEQVKAFMPAVRNAILMVIAHKTAKELLDRSGKEDLAEEIMREAMRPMGIDVDLPVRLREPVAHAKTETVVTAAAHGASASASTPVAGSASSPEATLVAASASASAPASAAAAASSPVLAAAPASAAASVAIKVAVAPAARPDKPKVRAEIAGPIHHVHFSSFIIQ